MISGIVTKPVISEKSMQMAALGWYTFAVSPKADKKQIKRAIESQFGVNVVDIRTQTVHGKTRRVGRKMHVIKKADWKKTEVKLKKGQKIDTFEVQDDKGK